MFKLSQKELEEYRHKRRVRITYNNYQDKKDRFNVNPNGTTYWKMESAKRLWKKLSKNK